MPLPDSEKSSLSAPNGVPSQCHSNPGPCNSLAAHFDSLARHFRSISATTTTEPVAQHTAHLTRLLSEAEGYLDSIAPIRKLPVEILCKIFAEACVLDRNAADERASLARADLLRLSRVCSRWHDIVMDSPHLWSTIQIKGDLWPKDPDLAAPFLRLLELALERTASHPLYLSLSISTYSPVTVEAALHRVVKHCGRWKTVELRIDEAHLDALASIKGHLPMLEYLVLYYYGSDKVEIFSVAPKLTVVDLMHDRP
ncbi:hypothetical protein DFH07DRAFT_1021424 [Mycena maculata]|uniref:F-box domain-containing protein n=1 Tax=Mycena maculata TaxID=230809 RepID=A0AAD7NHN4_9AGAR|nr:hypothetical protein DFH07DRAFT_1021424 [Mycena maculata]